MEGTYVARYSPRMTCDVRYTNEFGDRLGDLSVDAHKTLFSGTRLLEARVPRLG
jgi:hypothetical protein